ncbi:hypothetical protein CW304_21945 [Bacillus sp. UFRGS-B20]|nr:hypothetical protein CW304_21945 [Bacillus sp. UFRGS-B20]
MTPYSNQFLRKLNVGFCIKYPVLFGICGLIFCSLIFLLLFTCKAWFRKKYPSSFMKRFSN